MAKTSRIEPGDVVYIKLDPTVGHEKQKTRPCLVLENGNGSRLNLLIVVPITNATSKVALPFVMIDDLKRAGCHKPSVVDCYQIRCVSLERLGDKIGSLSDETMDAVRKTIAILLDIGEEHIA